MHIEVSMGTMNVFGISIKRKWRHCKLIYICISESSRSMCAVAWKLPWKMGEDDVIMGSPPSGELSSIRSSGFTVLADAVLLLQQIETTFLREVHKPAHLTLPTIVMGRREETTIRCICTWALFTRSVFFWAMFTRNVISVRHSYNLKMCWMHYSGQCSHVTLNYVTEKDRKEPLMKSGPKNATCKCTFHHTNEQLLPFIFTDSGRTYLLPPIFLFHEKTSAPRSSFQRGHLANMVSIIPASICL